MVNEQFVKEPKAEASTFVLIINILDGSELPPADVLRQYKNQTAVEISFRLLKNSVYADGIFIKSMDRVVGIGYVLAFLIYSLLQRRVRRKLAKEIEPLVISRPAQGLQSNRSDAVRDAEAAFYHHF